MKRQVVLLVSALAVVIVVLGGWFAFSNPEIAAAFGMHHSTGGPNGMASSTPGMMGMRGGFTQGSIATLNGNGFTVSLQDGTTKTISLTATSTIQYFATASSTPATTTIDHLSVGQPALVMGTAAIDGSIAATRVLVGAFPTHMPGSDRGMPRSGMSSSTWMGRGQGGPGRMGTSTSAMPPDNGAPMQQ